MMRLKFPLPMVQRAKEAMASTPTNPSREHRAQQIAYNAMDTEGEDTLQLVQQALSVYPLSVEAWSVLGYHYLHANEGRLALLAFETGVTAGKPGFESESPRWDCIEHRPYLRATRGVALAAAQVGDLEKAIEVAEQLEAWDHRALQSHLSTWYLKARRWDDAEQLFDKLKESRMECGTAYSWVLLLYERLRQGRPVASQLDRALGIALEQNMFVPGLLLAPELPLVASPSSYSSGSKSEALLYAKDNHSLWHSIPGAVSWLSYMKDRGGAKPGEQTLIRLLRKRVLLLYLPNGQWVRGTQSYDCMLGRALPEFQMKSEALAPHIDGSPIWIHRHSYEERNANKLWTRVQYEDILAAPFWNVLLVNTSAHDTEEGPAEDEKEEPQMTKASKCWQCSALETPQALHKLCANCSVAAYCSRTCQEKHWKIHKKECKKIQRSKIWGLLDAEVVSRITCYLDLKEKAMVASLNKAWLDAATCDKAVSIDPDVVGANLNPVLDFVASRFQFLQDVSIHIDQRYILSVNSWSCEDDEPSLELHGNVLSNFFANCPALRSITVGFDDCVEQFTSQVLLQEGGFDTLHQQTSLQSLKLYFPFFQSATTFAQTLNHMRNLQYLKVYNPHFDRSAYCTDMKWEAASQLMVTIGNLSQLRSLSLSFHGLEDSDLRGLIPILPELRGLELEGVFGDFPRSQISLTDASMTLVSEHCRNLQALNVSYNRRITIGGIRKVLGACPGLRELDAVEAGLESRCLEEVVGLSPTLRMVRFGSGMPSNAEQHDLINATVASQGNTLFMGFQLYEPAFDAQMMARHEQTKKAMEKLEPNESNHWSEWDDWEDPLWDDWEKTEPL